MPELTAADPLLDQHLESLELQGRAPSTLNRHRRVLRRWQLFLAEHRQLSLEQVLPEDVLAFAELRTKAGVKDQTVRLELCVLSTLYDWLYRLGKIHRDPTASLPTMICQPLREKQYLTVEECFRLLDAIDTRPTIGRRNYAIIALLWSTGLRNRELCALRWRDLDLDQGTLLVRRAKGGKQRQIFLNDRVKDDLLALHRELAPQPTDPLFYAMNAARSERQRNPLSASRLVEMVRKLAHAAGIDKPINPLSFRHTFATHMFEAGATIADIKELLGHDDETESTVYVHVTLDAARHLLQDHVANPGNHPAHRKDEA